MHINFASNALIFNDNMFILFEHENMVESSFNTSYILVHTLKHITIFRSELFHLK